MNSRLEFALGLAKKAGAVRCGTESVREEIRSSKSKLVILAEDASANTKKRVVDCCAHYGVRLYTPAITSEALGHAVGSRALIAAVSVARHHIAVLVEGALNGMADQSPTAEVPDGSAAKSKGKTEDSELPEES